MVPAKSGNRENVGKFVMGREVETEILKNFMLQGSQSTGKYTTPERSYILKCTSYLVPRESVCVGGGGVGRGSVSTSSVSVQ